KFPHSLVAAATCLIMSALPPVALRAAGAEEPLWAYGFVTPAASGEKAAMPAGPAHALRTTEDAGEQTRKRHIAGSTGEYSLFEIRNGSEVVDWFPGEHPPLTPILKHGPASLGANTYGCAFCHMPNGKGRPENAPLAGLPASYFIHQMQDFRNGLRSSSEPRK